MYKNAAYKRGKAKARNEAIRWQSEFSERDHSWGELVECQSYFLSLAKRYGLVREFRENGII